MSDWLQKVDRAAKQLDVDWSTQRSFLAERGFLLRRRRRRVVRATAGVAIVVMAVLGVRAALVDSAQVSTEIATSPSGNLVRFADGSTATLLGKASAVTPLEISDELIKIELTRGSARFEVTKRPSRLFQVVAAGVLVEVVGTRFVVARGDTRVQVNVEQGKVRVRGLERIAELQAGDLADFNTAPVPSDLHEASTPQISDSVKTPDSTVKAPDLTKGSTKRFKVPAHGVRTGPNEAAVGGGAPSVPEASFDELLRAADEARFNHDPGAAVAPLQRITRRYRYDDRAALAAFTLGRILADDLNRPRDAADAFADVRTLAPGGPLAEDALAREVETRMRSNDVDRARSLAQEYVRRYPHGRHLRSVGASGLLE